MIYLYLFGTCFHFIYVFMIIGKYINGIDPAKKVDWTDIKNNHDTLAKRKSLM